MINEAIPEAIDNLAKAKWAEALARDAYDAACSARTSAAVGLDKAREAERAADRALHEAIAAQIALYPY